MYFLISSSYITKIQEAFISENNHTTGIFHWGNFNHAWEWKVIQKDLMALHFCFNQGHQRWFLPVGKSPKVPSKIFPLNPLQFHMIRFIGLIMGVALLGTDRIGLVWSAYNIVGFKTTIKFPTSRLLGGLMSMKIFKWFCGQIRMCYFTYLSLNIIIFSSFSTLISICVSLVRLMASSISPTSIVWSWGPER